MRTEKAVTIEPESGTIQFSIAYLMLLTAAVSLWGVAFTRGNEGAWGFGLAAVSTVVTWAIVGWWADGLARAPRTVVLASVATAMMIAAGWLGIWTISIWRPLALVVLLTPMMAVSQLFGSWPELAVAAFWMTGWLIAGLTFLVWKWALTAWDRWEAHAASFGSDLRAVSSAGTVVVAIPAVPVLGEALMIGARLFLNHSTQSGDLGISTPWRAHLWFVLSFHLFLLAAAATLVVVLQLNASRIGDRLPRWLRLAVWGYLCLYAVLSLLVLFPLGLGGFRFL